MKNKLYSNAEFQESLDRSLSSLQPDRLMAGRIIASGKEEEKVKKILNFFCKVFVRIC